MDANTVLKKMRITIECLMLRNILIAAGVPPERREEIYEDLVITHGDPYVYHTLVKLKELNLGGEAPLIQEILEKEPEILVDIAG